MSAADISLLDVTKIPDDVRIYNGDCIDILSSKIKSKSVNLIIAFPPYADQRMRNYGGIYPDNYVDLFLPRDAVKPSMAPSRLFQAHCSHLGVHLCSPTEGIAHETHSN